MRALRALPAATLRAQLYLRQPSLHASSCKSNSDPSLPARALPEPPVVRLLTPTNCYLAELTGASPTHGCPDLAAAKFRAHEPTFCEPELIEQPRARLVFAVAVAVSLARNPCRRLAIIRLVAKLVLQSSSRSRTAPRRAGYFSCSVSLEPMISQY